MSSGSKKGTQIYSFFSLKSLQMNTLQVAQQGPYGESKTELTKGHYFIWQISVAASCRLVLLLTHLSHSTAHKMAGVAARTNKRQLSEDPRIYQIQTKIKFAWWKVYGRHTALNLMESTPENAPPHSGMSCGSQEPYVWTLLVTHDCVRITSLSYRLKGEITTAWRCCW